ncbi:PEP-CTERM protein-sorting domain-containing protein [Rubritalea squalenifaciens DSM 18772]|uniref:PEP-CTERM protein-sorting domain-containing protein n=1 Tax=Rubritalea squalenifaciens DSM 18772 TaxID=1123071 RepID=A0A1M6QFP4_9BACT|nr:PEP-CTERM sorting domain-containing protein [Rubritalea squalenifaciens]SHK19124.1 PEP-CTERM protein-sorting domain-containing protein [Rubritalea squalenifaciens DSM 18772]
MTIKHTLTIITSLVLAGAANAAVLARWTPTSGDNITNPDYFNEGSTPSADETASFLTVSTIDRVNNPFNATNSAARWVGRWDDAVNRDAINDNYTEFTITPDSGYQVSYESFTYDVANAGDYTMYVRTSLDNFASDIASDTLDDTSTDKRFIVDLSSEGSLTNQTSDVTFRLYIVKNDVLTDNTLGYQPLIGNNSDPSLGFIVNGTVSSVPEPSSTAMLGFAGLGLIMRRRR